MSQSHGGGGASALSGAVVDGCSRMGGRRAVGDFDVRASLQGVLRALRSLLCGSVCGGGRHCRRLVDWGGIVTCSPPRGPAHLEAELWPPVRLVVQEPSYRVWAGAPAQLREASEEAGGIFLSGKGGRGGRPAPWP